MKRKVLLLSAAGIAAGLVYALEINRRKQSPANRDSQGESLKDIDSPGRGTSMARTRNGEAMELKPEDHQLDDHGTNQAEAAHSLKEIRDTSFGASNEKLALVLGRPTEEIEQWANGDGLIDGDVVMKARALAIQRGVDVE